MQTCVIYTLRLHTDQISLIQLFKISCETRFVCCKTRFSLDVQVFLLFILLTCRHGCVKKEHVTTWLAGFGTV